MIVKTVAWMRVGGGRKRPERVRATGARMIVFELCCLPFPMWVHSMILQQMVCDDPTLMCMYLMVTNYLKMLLMKRGYTVLVAESVWYDTQSYRLCCARIRASLTHISARARFRKTGRTLSPCRCRSFIWCGRCPGQRTPWTILAAGWCVNGQMWI